MARSASVDAAPPSLVFKAFETPVGTATIVEGSSDVIILVPRAEHAADLDNHQVKSIQKILGNRINTALAQDVFEAFSKASREAVDVNINQTTLRSVNSNLLGGG
jgi:hypothetical protein